MNAESQTDYKIYNLEELMDYQFKEYKELQNEELILKLFAALPVNIEKEFVPRYVFDIVLKIENKKIGFITRSSRS